MISCAQYDYIELACLYQISVELQLNDGSAVQGDALDTQYDANRRECLVLEIEGKKRMFATECLVSMKALTPNTHFDLIQFS